MHDHPKSNIDGKNSAYHWISDFVYGGIDGAVTTFAVVAGVTGADLSLSVLLILGFANLFADGFSMAVGKYSSDKATQDLYEKIRQIEFQHLEEKPQREREEIREILEKYGFKGRDLERSTNIITSNSDHWVDLMMRHEFHMTSENIQPLKGSIITFTSFIIIGLIPLLGYIFKSFLRLNAHNTFILTSFATLSALFIVGTIKSRFSSKQWFISGLETTAIGGIAASIAYLVGFLLKGVTSL